MAYKLLTFLYAFSELVNFLADPESINLSYYHYPVPDEKTDKHYKIAIFATNDIHGTVFPKTITHPLTNNTYKYGGLAYLSTYKNILKKQWQDRLLWLDGGDQFQGGIESRLSNGSIITEFFNIAKVNGSAIGNHEFDYGQDWLKTRLSQASWAYIASNIQNDTNQTEFLPNTKLLQMFKVDEVLVGVIGLTTVETPFTTQGNLTGIHFKEYRSIVIELSAILRNQGANAIVLNTHVGMYCPDFDAKMTLKMRNKFTYQKECDEDEMNKLLNSLDSGTVDAVVGGHVHDVVHHWVNGVPVVQSINGGFYSNVIYLSFDKKTKKILQEETQVEGPLPTCEKIFENSRRCDFINKTTALDIGELKNFTFHNEPMIADNSLNETSSKWWDQIAKYKKKIAYTEILLEKEYYKESVLSNLYCDAIKNASQSDISVHNEGAFRVEWFPGDITIEDVWNMNPFDNYIVSFEMTGAEIKKMMTILQNGSKGYYATSGLAQHITTHQNVSIVNVTLFNGTEIDEQKVYKVGSIDFLIHGGDDFKDVVNWYQPRNLTNYTIERNEIINYLTNIAFIKTDDFIDVKHPRLIIN